MSQSRTSSISKSDSAAITPQKRYFTDSTTRMIRSADKALCPRFTLASFLCIVRIPAPPLQNKATRKPGHFYELGNPVNVQIIRVFRDFFRSDALKESRKKLSDCFLKTNSPKSRKLRCIFSRNSWNDQNNPSFSGLSVRIS